ncbi:MAG: helix-turn-helix transcriptional regulator [Oscillospiraceae bacterium]|nr:helix-turn-helix transcriptional regulator [Oscillospiraceae bacterium]
MNQMKIGSFLKELRRENKLTQEQLAEKLNVSNRSVSRWENGSTLPDISILIELAEFYDVDIKEIIDGERKSEDMNEETKEMMSKVVDYTTADKEMIITKTQKYSATAGIALIAGIVLAVFDLSDKLYQITEVLFGVALIYIIAVFLLSTGKATEIRKNKLKTRKYLIFIGAVLIVTVISIFVLLGVNF